MPAAPLKINNRTAYFRKAFSPDFKSESVLTRDQFRFVDMWIRRNAKSALPYWQQAGNYYRAARTMPLESAPLAHYYFFLNAIKAMLIVKGVVFSDLHGASGSHNPASKRSLSNEMIEIKSSGIASSLSTYFKEKETTNKHSLRDLLGALVFVHRAYRQTFVSAPELFIPLENIVYRKHPKDRYVWLSAEVPKRYNDKRTLKTLPSGFEIDEGYSDKCIIRTKQRIKWHEHGGSKRQKEAALTRLGTRHFWARQHLHYIAAARDLWYIRRNASGVPVIERRPLTIMLVAMHRLSELSRYDPKGLSAYLRGRFNWLIAEFIDLGPDQFLNEVACELTGLEIRHPGIRP